MEYLLKVMRLRAKQQTTPENIVEILFTVEETIRACDESMPKKEAIKRTALKN